MKTNHHPASTPHEYYGLIAVAGFLLLMAWGNAVGMLVFSLLGFGAWFALPETREGGESAAHHNLLILAIGAGVAFVVALILTLMSGG